MVLSLSAKGLTHGEIASHLRDVYGAAVSQQTITTITDKVMDEPPAGRSVPGGVHRLREREDPRRAGRQPAEPDDGGEGRFTTGLILDVFAVLDRHGYKRGSDQAVGGAVGVLLDLVETYETAVST